ncbi:hypothetical protein ACVBEF_00205 [Glaciimonas sp. GG7]
MGIQLFSNYQIIGHRPGEVTNYPSSGFENCSKARNVFDKMADILPFKICKAGKQATAERLRSQFIGISNKSISSVLSGKPPVLKGMIGAVGDPTWAKKNKSVAEDALKKVRLALYDKDCGSYKSDNKRKTTDLEAEMTRIENKNGEFGTFGELEKFGDITDGRHVSAIRTGNIWKSTRINCAGLALAVKDYVACKHRGVQVSSLIFPTHALAAVGTIAPEYADLPLEEWPEHIYVCDPWANITCSAPDYPAKFAEKMEKWSNDNKEIYTDDHAWINPTDEKWVSSVKEIPKIGTRYQYKGGQYAGVAVLAPSVALPAFQWRAPDNDDSAPAPSAPNFNDIV